MLQYTNTSEKDKTFLTVIEIVMETSHKVFVPDCLCNVAQMPPGELGRLWKAV